MTRKSKRHGGSPAVKQASQLHGAFLDAIRSGRTTRGQFDRWHAQHHTSGRGLVITLREVKPVSASGTARRSSRRHAR